MKRIILLTFLTLALSLSAFAESKGIYINVPLTAGSFKIESKKITGKIKKSGSSYKASKLSVKVKNMKSGMDLRDEHMKNPDRLDMKKHPKIYVTSVKASGGKGTGIIKIKGKKQKIKFTYTTSGGLFIAKFKLNVTKFPLKKLKYLGVGVKDIIDITARVPIAK